MPPHTRWPKVLLIAVAAAALLLGGATIALNWAFPAERLAQMLSAEVSAASGRAFAVRGALSIRLLPRIAVVAHEVVFGNAPWGSRKDMLAMKLARFDIAFWPLLQGRVDITSLSLDGVDLLLETDRAGNGNWVMTAPEAAASPQAAQAGQGNSAAAPRSLERGRAASMPQAGGDADASPLSLRVERVHLANAQVTFRDGRSGTRHSFDLKQLELSADGEGQRIDATFETHAQRWQLKGPVGRLADLAANQTDWPFDLQLGSDGARLSAKGQLRQGSFPRAVTADIAASLTQPAALAPWIANVAAVPLPIEVKARLNYSAQGIRAEALQVSVAEQRLSGQLTAQSGTPWKIDAQLASPSIDLARWLPARATVTAPAAGERRWLFGNAPIAFDALPQGPATLALRVDKLLLPGLPPLSNLNAQLNAQPGRFKADPLSFGVAGGNLRGSLAVLTSAAAPPRVALQAEASNLSMDALLQATGHTAFASGGRLQMHSAMNLAGATPRALAAGATGEVLVSISGTTLGSGVSPMGTNLLPRLLQAITLQPGAQPHTRIDCAVFRLPLKNGVAAIDRSIAIETDQFAITAKGEIRLGDETLELAFRPTQKTGLKVNPVDLAQLVLLKGPLLDPKLTLDAKGAAGLAVAIGAAGATGGLSLLAERLLHTPPDPQPCRFAATGQGGPAPAKAPSAATPGPVGQPTSVEKALPDLMRRIFK